MIEYEKRAMIEAEDKYTFRQSTQISMQTGLIGHLRADMDTDGNGFFSSWFDFREELKTDGFKAEFDDVINSLREEGDILHNRRALAKYCYCTPQSRMQEEPGYYGVRVDTEKYAYLLRLNPDRGEYNLYCYCYRRDWLDQHLKDAEKGIRFIDSHYKELFRIPDGGKVKIHYSWNEEQIRTCRYMDLLTYLRNYEPQELVHVSGNTYCTKEHDSLRISNGKWCWFSQGIGGRSALDYLIKVKGIPFTQAAEIILGREAEKPPVFYRQKERKHTELLMPELSETTEQVEKYLYSRGIHPVIIRYCLDNRLLFESVDFHNAVFVGHDKDGKARYGALRSTVSSYKGELTGSDKRFSFFLEGKPNAEHIHVFESAIDLLSFATLMLLAGCDWKSETYLSLAGVFQTKREDVVPVALSRFLDEHPSVRKIHLHLDNDAVGRGAVKGIVGGLQGKYQVYDEPPAHGKDVNDELKIRVGLMRERKERERT